MRVSFQGFLKLWCPTIITSLAKKWLVVVSGRKHVRANTEIKDPKDKIKALLRFVTATKGRGIPQHKNTRERTWTLPAHSHHPFCSQFTNTSQPGTGGWGLGKGITPHLLFEGQETSLCQFLLADVCQQSCQAVGEGAQMLSGNVRWGAAPAPLRTETSAAWQEQGLREAKTKKQQLILMGGSCHQNVQSTVWGHSNKSVIIYLHVIILLFTRKSRRCSFLF